MAKRSTEAVKVPLEADLPYGTSNEEQQAIGAALAREYAAGRIDLRTAAREYTAATLNPQADTEPSTEQDEHRGLAGRILDLRKALEEQRLAGIQERAHLNQRMGNLEQLVSAMATRIDREVEEIGKTQRELGNALREGGEQVRVAGEFTRKMTDQMKVLEEIREMASDPHEVVKPILRSLAFLRGDLEALSKTIDIRFEAMPKARSQPIESRSEDENPIVKLGTEIRKLKDRLAKVEQD